MNLAHIASLSGALLALLLAARPARAEGALLSPAVTPAATPAVGAFVGVEWRGLALADHLSHGPGVQAGVLLFGGHLKLGIAGFARPGPINPATFDVMPAGGATYKGQSQVALRSDGGLVGLLVAPVFDVPGTDALALELPVIVGQGGFGFYLSGDDRETPDGRKPSAWENELLDGRDSSFALGLDVGVRLAFKPAGARWVRPYVGAHYTTVFGYDTYVKDAYAGFGVAAGVQFGTF